jgi:hypothetical protein
MELITSGRRVRGSVWPRVANPVAADLTDLLGLLDFACLKINRSKPWLVLIICRLHSTNIASIGIHPPAPSRVTDVTAVAAFSRPGLVIFLAVVSQSCPHPFCKPGQAVAVPLLQRVTAERLTGAVALICQNGELVYQVRMVRPARRDDIGNIPDMLVVHPGDDSLQPGPDFSSQLWRLAGCGIPGPLQVR